MDLSNSNTLQAFWAGLGTMLGIVISIFSAAILSRILSKLDYGTYKQILYVYNTLVIFFTAGLPSVYSYFLPKLSVEEGKYFVLKVIKLLFGLGLIFSISLFIFSNFIANYLNNPVLEDSIKLFSVIPFFLLPTLGVEGILATYRQTHKLAIYSVISKIFLMASVVLPVLYFTPSIKQLTYGWIIGAILNLILFFVFIYLVFRKHEKVKDSFGYNDILKYSFPIVLASIYGVLLSSSFPFFISRFHGPEAYAEFSNGFIDIPIVSIVAGASALVLLPMFSKLNETKDGVFEMSSLFKSAILKSALIIYPISIFFIFYGSEIMVLIYTEKYSASSNYFRINNFLNFFNIIVFAPLLLSLGKSKFYANFHLVVAVFAWLICFLLSRYKTPPEMYAITSVTLTIFMIIYALNYSAKLLNLKLSNMIDFKSHLVIVFHCFIVNFIVKYFMNFLPNYNKIILLIIAFSISSLLVVLTSNFFRLNYITPLKPILIRFKTSINVFK